MRINLKRTGLAGSYSKCKQELMGCNAVQFGEKPTFRKNIQPLSSGPKSKPSKIPDEAGSLIRVKDKA
jgi:hypothetical protein